MKKTIRTFTILGLILVAQNSKANLECQSRRADNSIETVRVSTSAHDGGPSVSITNNGKNEYNRLLAPTARPPAFSRVIAECASISGRGMAAITLSIQVTDGGVEVIQSGRAAEFIPLYFNYR